MNRMSQWLAIGVGCWFTWLIYISNTHHGTEAQADLVAWIVHLLFLVALNSYRMDDQFLVRILPKTHMLKAWSDVLALAQVVLLAVTLHWWLCIVRVAAEWIIRRNIYQAVDRVHADGRTFG